MNRTFFSTTSRLALLAGLGTLVASPAFADPVLRQQKDLHGNAIVIGSTMTYDCGDPASGIDPGPVPPGATVSCNGVSNTGDTSGDLYWRDNMANTSITSVQARTSATLQLPPGAKVVYARLYWSALLEGTQPDKNVSLDWNKTANSTINADHCGTLPYFFPSHPEWNYYQCSADITGYVNVNGSGAYRVSDIESLDLNKLQDQPLNVDFSAWTLVVFYEKKEEPLRNLALFDSFEVVDPEHSPSSISTTLQGILVPPGFEARMWVFAYEGDKASSGAPSGDYFLVNDTKMSNASNPVDDFFNSSRTSLGNPYSGSLDVPKLSGAPGSMAGFDLDAVDVTKFVSAGDTSVKVSADSEVDKFILGGFVTSITNKAPDFSDLNKTVQDLNGGAVVPGDVMEYTISGSNTGNDDAVDVVLEDKLDPGLQFVPGSIKLVKGGVTGTKTDQAGDDQGEYVASSRKIVVRLGTGATATHGGTIKAGDTFEVKFQAKVVAKQGTIPNVGKLTAQGKSGGQSKTFETDSDPNKVGNQSTDITIRECSTNSDCTNPAKPHCDDKTHVCVGCVSDADCTDPQNPACQPNGTCGECSATNASLCKDPTPVCDIGIGKCVLCTPGTDGDATKCLNDPDGRVCISESNADPFCGCETDADCGAVDSGRVCDPATQKCIDGCRGQGGNGCPTDKECTSKDASIGQCVDPTPDAGPVDAGNGNEDAGVPAVGDTGESGNDSGCACSAPGTTGSSTPWWPAALLALAGLTTLRRRRRDLDS